MKLNKFKNNLGCFIRVAENEFASDITNLKEKALFRHCSGGRDAVPIEEFEMLIELLKLHNIEWFLPIGS